MVKKHSRSYDLFKLSVWLLVLVAINYIGSFFFTRLDLTEEKRFTLSDQTINTLDSLEEELVITVYLEGDLDAGFLRLQKETKEMLDEFEAYADQGLSYEFVDPYSLNKDANKVFEQLGKKGLQPTNFQSNTESGSKQQYLFPGAIIYYQGKSFPVQLLKSEISLPAEQVLNKSIESLEFEFSNTIRKLSHPVKPAIAFTSGHGEFIDEEIWDFATGLQEYYNVFEIKIDSIELEKKKVISRVELKENQAGQLDFQLLDKYKAIVIAGPKENFSDKECFLIDQFIMKGGNILWALDGNTANMDSLLTGRISMAFPSQNKLFDLSYSYGARINPNIVQDLTCGPVSVFDGYQGNQPRFTKYQWIYDPLLLSDNSNLINTNLDPIRTNFASTIDTIPVPGISKQVVLKTSESSRILRTPVRVSLQTAVRRPNIDRFNKGHQTIGVLLEGRFESYYKNRVVDFPIKKQGDYSRMVVLSDASIIKNDVTREGRPYPLSVNMRYQEMFYDNKKFLMNAMNYICGDEDLIPMRSRDIKIRLLDKKKIEEDGDFWKLINLLGPLVIMLIIVIPITVIRRMKYSK
jgi:ABC-2 type transport system permease protein